MYIGRNCHHHHHHFIKSPVFNHSGEPITTSVVAESVVSPLISPMASATLSATVTTLDTIFPGLPPPVDNGPSEAVVALYDAANESVKSKSNRTTTDTMTQLFDSCFFSAILLVQWSNVVGPKVSKAWSGEPMDAQLLTTIARQVLNGEMGRTLSDIEPKWLILHRQGLVCTAFLYQDPCSLSLCALVMVVPVRYLRNFTQYFKVLSQRVPRQLIDVLVKLRKIYRRLNISWSTALDYFGNIHLFPLIQSIMDLESVSLPTEWPKITHTLLAKDAKFVVDVDFLVQMITSHLQTCGSTLLIGKSLTSVNIVINTLALFLSTEEKSRSSHARKHHKYMPDLYLQGLLLQDMEDTKTRLETVVLKSPVPTTLVDLNKMQIKQTVLQPGYRRLAYQYHDTFLSRLEDDIYAYTTSGGYSKAYNEAQQRKPFTFQTTNAVSPMVKTLIDETFQLPSRLREPFIRQWRRGLIKRATCLAKFIEVETSAILAKASSSSFSSAPSASVSSTSDSTITTSTKYNHNTNTNNNISNSNSNDNSSSSKNRNTASNIPATLPTSSTSSTTAANAAPSSLQANITTSPQQQDIVQRMMDAIDTTSWQDFLVVLTMADKLRPGMVEFVDSYSNRL
ncbi:unnamed protein product [Absidia cylindrospora]